MPIKLNTSLVRNYLRENKRTMAWLAREVGISPELMRYRLLNCVPGDADAIAKVIGIPDPKTLIVIE